MDVKHQITKGEHSSVKLNISIEQEDVDQAYRETLDLYTKEVQLKGFRKGKVPRQILESKFKEALEKETLSKIVEEKSKDVLKSVQEAPISPPVLESKVETLPKEGGLDLVLSYDVYPEIQLGSYKALSAERQRVVVKDEDVDKEVGRLREQNAVVKEKNSGTVAKNDIVTLDYWEIDEKKNIREGTKREDFVFTVGTGHNYYEIDDELIGVEKGKEKTITKTFPPKYKDPDLAGTKRIIVCVVKVIKEKILPEPDHEFAQDVSSEYKTMTDLKAGIKAKIQEQGDNLVKTRMIDSMIKTITEKTVLALPESMVKAELHNSWHLFLRNHNLKAEEALKVLESQEKTQEDLFKEWRPETEKRVRQTLTVAKIIETEKLSVSDKEAEEEALKKAKEMKISPEELKRNFGEKQLYQYIKNDLVNQKLEKFLLENAKVKDGKKISYSDLLKEGSHARTE